MVGSAGSRFPALKRCCERRVTETVGPAKNAEFGSDFGGSGFRS